MLRSQFRPTNLLALLFGAALVLSLGFNVLLLRTTALAWPEDDSDELAATAAELHLTQRLLTQCQSRQQRQDSLLQAHNATPPVAPNTPAFYSAQ